MAEGAAARDPRIVPFPGCIITSDGKLMNLADPDPASYTKEMMAHSLSMTVRYRGQCKFFWSVAQHSLRVAKLISIWYKDEPLVVRATLTLMALIHDNPEAVLGDMPTPEKVLHPERSALEDMHFAKMCKGLGLPFTELDPRVKAADTAIGCVEQFILIPQNKYWPHVYSEQQVQDILNLIAPADICVEDMEEVEFNYLFLYNALAHIVKGVKPEEAMRLLLSGALNVRA